MSTIQRFELPQPIYPGAPDSAGGPAPLPAPVAPPPAAPAMGAPVPVAPPALPWWKTKAARITAGVVGGLLLASAAQGALKADDGQGRREAVVPSREGVEVGVEAETAAVTLVGSAASSDEIGCVAAGLTGEPDLVASLQGGATLLPSGEATVAADLVVACVSPETIVAALTAVPELAELDSTQLACVQDQIWSLDADALAEYLALGLSGAPELQEVSAEIFGACSY